MHPFWMTLMYIEAEHDANKEVRHANADDKEYFQSLVHVHIEGIEDILSSGWIRLGNSFANCIDKTMFVINDK